MQLVKRSGMRGRGACILDSDIVKTSVVLYRAEFAILLIYKKRRGWPWVTWKGGYNLDEGDPQYNLSGQWFH